MELSEERIFDSDESRRANCANDSQREAWDLLRRCYYPSSSGEFLTLWFVDRHMNEISRMYRQPHGGASGRVDGRLTRFVFGERTLWWRIQKYLMLVDANIRRIVTLNRWQQFRIS